jgi:hypothetical protein
MNEETARTFLSKMPGEVFDIYVAPLIESHGWPFDSEGISTDALEARRWYQMFDLQSVQTIGDLSWKRQWFPFSLNLFFPRSKQIVEAIIEHHAGIYFHAGIANVADTKTKFFRAREYIAGTGRMPVPVILQYDMFGLRVLDGNHRVAAMASFPNTSECVVDCWIGYAKGDPACPV